jgi:hypothetical protein
MRIVTVSGPEGPLAAVEDSRGRRAIKNSNGRSFRDAGELIADANWLRAVEAASDSVSS